VSAAVFDVLPQVGIESAELFILSRKALHFLVALVDLVDSESERVFGLVERLREVVVAHDFSLRGLVVVQGLAFELLGESADFGDVLLEADEVGLRVGALAFEAGDVLHEAVDVAVQDVVLILVAHDLLLQDALLSPQLVGVLVQVIDLPASGVVVQL
jgi:hypothetical protein